MNSFKVNPLAFDSFSVRSMSTAVKTDIKILIDPGIALGPLRYGLPPSRFEEEAFQHGRAKIIEEAESSDLIIITHYHYDHYPFPNDEEMNKIFDGKNILIKSLNKINKSQKIRGEEFKKMISGRGKLIYADYKTFNFGSTEIKISKPVPHGPDNTRLGFVVMTTINYKNKTFMHTSDVQGPISKSTTGIIVKENPDFLIIDGPPTYLAGYRLSFRDVKLAAENFKRIVESTGVKEIVIDHHLLRDLNYKNKFPVFEFTNELGCRVETAAEFLGLQNKMLEAHRKEYSNF